MPGQTTNILMGRHYDDDDVGDDDVGDDDDDDEDVDDDVDDDTDIDDKGDNTLHLNRNHQPVLSNN